ncbi:NADH-dependent flavin oxidoreductase [Photobacterium gaetbulicola]|uniref:Putative dehydrogenase n=1 Tax=Photobacterium gaetbulicola Gung47 TaxID=658445 RepID=A0A0C5W1V1_9GAMM|nr:hypothetical protein [Photobacterium gaetbulicola]AJR05311.1 putative dehydrogenase [Photobacterium gaetbulicola Gung47]PSU02619.1 NADH-dependent flavin oxidoreductase [Photobacterium gaetbulicola]
MNSPNSEVKCFNEGIWVKGHYFRNRLGFAPMSRLSSLEGIPRQDTLDLLIRRASSGISVVYTEAILSDQCSAQGLPGQSLISTSEQVMLWKKTVNAVHDAGAIAIAQLNHCGRLALPEFNPAGKVIGPSSIAAPQIERTSGRPYPPPVEMSLSDIEQVIEGFVKSAKAAVQAGFDGVEVHGAHGYLLHQFLSKQSNQREDQFGGNIVNRCRMIRHILAALKQAIPDSCLLSFRLSDCIGADNSDSAFTDIEEYQSIINELSKESVDVLSLATHNFNAKAWNSDHSLLEITRKLWKGPLFVAGGVYDKETANAALQNADLVLVGKSLLLNPNWYHFANAGWPLKKLTRENSKVAYGELILI